MSRCLITGGTGLIGAQLVRELCQDYEVYVLSRKSNVFRRLFQSLPVRLVEGDLSSSNGLENLPSEVEMIIHLAQSEHFRNFPSRAEHMFQVNTASVVKMLDYAVNAKAKSFLHASTGGVYGSGNNPFSPDDPISLTPHLGFYPTTKLCAELIAQSYQNFLNVITYRFFFVYGRGQQRHMLIPRLVDNIIEGNPIHLQGKDGLSLNPIHVSDAVRMIKASMKLNRSETLNVAGKEILTLRNIAEIIGNHVGREPVFKEDHTSQPSSLIGDIEKTKKILEIDPLVSFSQGVKDLIPETIQH
ncbi:MAG: dTDP-glucose 4,6-dehydratase [Chlamydiae bacterium]|nr:dTDP-glucose 4,6-dehydratase [Chlamydiota bacterium]